jgi:hypothetical protein
VRKRLNLSQVKRLAWANGNLEYKLYDYQIPAYKQVKSFLSELKQFQIDSEKDPDAELKRGNMFLLECHRRYGKSTVCSVLGTEIAEKYPNSIVRFVAPTIKQADDIFKPIFSELFLDHPNPPEWKENKKQYHFKNGSKISIHGTENDQMEALRGLRSDATFVTEIRDIAKLAYLINDILLPQTLTTLAPIIFDSTPAKDMTHYYYTLKDMLDLTNSSITFTLDDNDKIKESVKKKWIEQAGGMNSPTVQREYFCKRIKDESLHVIPEWEEKYVINKSLSSNFPFYHKYVAMDMGVRDNTSILYAYYDYVDATLRIFDEDLVNGDQLTTELISSMIKDKETKLFNNKYTGNILHQPDRVFRRIADNTNPQLLNDLSHTYGISFIPVVKTNLQAMVNKVRIWSRAGRIEIHENCKYLIKCIDSAMWKDGKKDDFARSDLYGHFDALAALVYLVRAIDENTSPLPKTHTGQNELVIYEKTDNEIEEMGKMFRPVQWMD